VSPTLFTSLEHGGWEEVTEKNSKTVALGPFEAFLDWNFGTYTPTLEQLLASAEVIEGTPFASLDEVRKWKAASGREKDLADIKLIDAYLAGKSEA